MSYSIEMFAAMFHSEQRHRSYVEAMRQSIKPGDVVVDIGTGIGVYAIEAARLGARKVYAIEPNPLVRLGPQLAADNGFGPNRIEFFEQLSTTFSPPEQADVIFADLRGRTPFYSANIESLYDAATRLLKPGGVLIPQVDRIYAALVSAPAAVTTLWDDWNKNPFGFDLSAARDVQFAGVQSAAMTTDDFLTAREQIAEIRYGVDSGMDVTHVWRSSAKRDAVAAGIAVWFDSDLIPGVSVTNSPDGPASVYGVGFLGFSEPIPVVSGQGVEVRVNIRKVDGSYVWGWGVDILASDDEARRVEGSSRDERGLVERRRGTSLESVPMIPKSLALYRPERTVLASQDMRVEYRALGLMIDGVSIGELAGVLAAEFPMVFATVTASRNFVVELASRYETLGPLQ